MQRLLVAVLVLPLLAALGCDKQQAKSLNQPATIPTPALPTTAGSTAASSEFDEEWQEYDYPEAGFKIRFPCMPTLVDAEGPSQSYSALGAQATCTVRVESTASAELENKLNELIQQQPRWQKEPVRKSVTLAGQPAVEVVTEGEPGKFKRQPPSTYVRYLKTASAIYIVSIECRPEPVNDPMRHYYFASFVLKK